MAFNRAVRRLTTPLRAGFPLRWLAAVLHRLTARGLPMRRISPLACCLGMLGALLAPGSAQALGILAAERTVKITYGLPDPLDPFLVVFYTQTASAPPGSGSWSGNVSYDHLASASQNSLISDTQLNGTGTVFRGGQYDSATSRYRVTFDASEATPYDFTVDNEMEYNPMYLMSAGALITLNQVDPNDHSVILQTIHSLSLYAGSPDASLEGVLAPGTYVLDYRLGIGPSHFGVEPGTVAFSLMAIPEPGTALLVMTGLLGLAYRQRRHDRTANWTHS